MSGRPFAGEKASAEVAPQPTVAAPQPVETVESTEVIAIAESAPSSWPDEAAESAMVSELRARGEVVTAPPASDAVEETDSGALPPLNDLVQKIPAEVREALEDLFRARFVTVKRVPKKALK